MHRFIDGQPTNNRFMLTKDNSWNYTTWPLLTIEHIVMFMVISIHIQINGKFYGSINIVSMFPLIISVLNIQFI